MKARDVIQSQVDGWLDGWGVSDRSRVTNSILSALDKAGLVICPKQPTEQMCREYVRGWHEHWESKGPGTTFGKWEDWPVEAQEAQRHCLSLAVAAHKESNE